MELKPDTLNGKKIFRGVTVGGDGIAHQDRFILFPPQGIKVTPGPVLAEAELVEQFMANLIRVSDQTGSPEIKAQAAAFERQLRRAASHWIKRATLNERERCRLALCRHGFKTATHAIEDGAA